MRIPLLLSKAPSISMSRKLWKRESEGVREQKDRSEGFHDLIWVLGVFPGGVFAPFFVSACKAR